MDLDSQKYDLSAQKLKRFIVSQINSNTILLCSLGYSCISVNKTDVDLVWYKWICTISSFLLLPQNVNPKKQTIGTSCKACGNRGMLDTRHKLCTFILKNPPGETWLWKTQLWNHEVWWHDLSTSLLTENTDSGSASVKKEKEKKNRKKDKENGSGSGEAGNQDNFDAPDAVVSLFLKVSLTTEEWWVNIMKLNRDKGGGLHFSSESPNQFQRISSY